jgi:GNAT superfamily N-acetyltransferase
MVQPTKPRAGESGSVRIAPEPFDSALAGRLIAEVQAEYVRRYGSEDISPVDAAEFAAPAGLFLVAWRDGSPVACGGWRRHDLPDGTSPAEIKRMYVRAEHRGRGYARLMLAELERTAQTAGFDRIILETGVSQPEAIALYLSSGYRPTTTFGVYADSPLCRCFGKSLG